MASGSGVPLNMTKRTAVYRLFGDADRLLYVGIAFDLSRRYMQHKKTKPWWPEVLRKEVCWFETRRLAEAAEHTAIVSERPCYNVRGVEDPVRMPDLPRVPVGPSDAVRKQQADALRKAAKADKRADAAKERTRAALRAAILEAASLGLGPAEIRRLIDYRLSEGHVSRVILGKA